MPKRAATVAIRHSLRDYGELLDLSPKSQDLAVFFEIVAVDIGVVFDAGILWAAVRAQLCPPSIFLNGMPCFLDQDQTLGVTVTCHDQRS